MNPQPLFCANPDCSSRGVREGGNIIGFGTTRRGQQRYQCKTCKRTFVGTKGTAFFGLHTPEEHVTHMISLLSYGCPPEAIVRTFDHDERTVAGWLKRAGEHAQSVHEHLLSQQPLDLKHVQADEIRVKMQKRQIAWMAMAVCVPSRLWLGGEISLRRDKPLIDALMRKVRPIALLAPLLVVVDGLAAYVKALQQAFREPQRTGKVGRPKLVAWPLSIGRVIKRKEGGHLAGIDRKLLRTGAEPSEAPRPPEQTLHTAYIERLNATFRARLCALFRRTRALARQTQSLMAGMYLVGTVYNLCTPHQTLRQDKPDGRRKWQPRTPGMAAGISDHCWSVHELLSFRVPPPPYVPPKRRGRPPGTIRTAAPTAGLA